MNITFLIGNGFDMRMGLKTSYKAVEENYVSISKQDQDLNHFAENIKADGEYWSNFEVAMGKYTEHFSQTNSPAYGKCMDSFINELIKYLMAEEGKIDYELCKGKITEVFPESLRSFQNELSKGKQNNINQLMKSSTQQININFVSFNYTHVLDKCLELAFGNNPVLAFHKNNYQTVKHMVNTTVTHVHGELPGPIIMGVDNVNQIENSELANNKRFCDTIIKPRINQRAGTLVDSDVINLLNTSSIVCIFGMSLGVTDKMWWQIIANNLVLGRTKHVIIYARAKEENSTYNQIFKLEDNIRDTFFNLSNLDDPQMEANEDKISVIINPKIFSLDLVKTTECEKKLAEIDKKQHLKSLEDAYNAAMERQLVFQE